MRDDRASLAYSDAALAHGDAVFAVADRDAAMLLDASRQAVAAMANLASYDVANFADVSAVVETDRL